MKNSIKKVVGFSLITCVTVWSNAQAGWSDTVSITMLDLVPGDGLYVTATPGWGCGGNVRVHVTASNVMFKEFLSVFMMAHASGKKIVAYLNCAGDDSEVTRLQVKNS